MAFGQDFELPEVICFIEGTPPGSTYFGREFCWVGDQNDDGFDDLLINHDPWNPSRRNDVPYQANRVELFYGGEDMDDEPDVLFTTPEDGVRAMYRLMGVYIKQSARKGILSPRGHSLQTIRGIIDKWARRGDLQTEGFINFVTNAANKDPDEVLKYSDKETFGKIIQAIIDFENSTQQGQFYIDIVPRALEGFTSLQTTLPAISSGNPKTVTKKISAGALNTKNTDR